MSVEKLSLLSPAEDNNESDASFIHHSRDQNPDLEDRGNAGKSHSDVDVLPLPSAKRYHLECYGVLVKWVVKPGPGREF